MECPTCKKVLKRATSRHKCPHGIWCGISGRPQLEYRSRTCITCNEVLWSLQQARLYNETVDKLHKTS